MQGWQSEFLVGPALQDWIEEVANRPIGENGEKPDICVVELGGTIGDIESMPFVEALRQFQFRVGMCLVHVSLVPALGQEGEQKTKPTQHSMHSLRSLGLSPDMLACRSTDELDSATKEKLALFCHVQPAAVLNLHDVSNIWKVPVLMQSQGALEHIGRVLGLDISTDSCHLERWQRMATRLDHLSSEEPVRIGMVGKYTHLGDSYLSVSKALMHAGVHCGKRVKVDLIESSNLESGDADSWEKLKGCDGILIPGGFGERGIEGKVSAARHARLTNKPFLGICLGMQIAVIEHVRAQLKNEAANSTEFDPDTPCPAVIFMPEQEGMGKGGTMRLGSRETTIVTEDCASFLLYGSKHSITERHRHRYEVNPEMVPQLEDVGLRFVATDMSGKRMEIVESRDHPFFVGCQFHPEFKSRPGQPAPLFLGLVLAAQSRLQDFLSDLGLGFNPTLSGSPFNSKAAPMAPDVADGPNRDDAL